MKTRPRLRIRIVSFKAYNSYHDVCTYVFCVRVRARVCVVCSYTSYYRPPGDE